MSDKNKMLIWGFIYTMIFIILRFTNILRVKNHITINEILIDIITCIIIFLTPRIIYKYIL